DAAQALNAAQSVLDRTCCLALLTTSAALPLRFQCMPSSQWQASRYPMSSARRCRSRSSFVWSSDDFRNPLFSLDALIGNSCFGNVAFSAVNRVGSNGFVPACL